MKPWLLMSPHEKQVRTELYLEAVSSTEPIDEAIITGVRPPETKLQALFELFLYQLRKMG